MMSVLAFCAVYMTGVIWFVQLVKYPMLQPPGGENPEAYHAEYTRRMGWVVGPVMMLEMLLQCIWMVQEPGRASYVGGSLLSLIWVSTFAIQVPLHQKLCQTYSPSLHRALVLGNWIRTLAWTARAGMLMHALS